MSKAPVDFVNVSTAGLESSPVAVALAGLRASARSRTTATRSSVEPNLHTRRLLTVSVCYVA
jgi:hypothetical protein